MPPASPTAVMPTASPMPRRRMEFGSPLPAITAAAQPDPQRPIPIFDKGAPLIMESKRSRRSKYYLFSACTARPDDTKLDERAVQYDRDTNMFVYMGAHDDRHLGLYRDVDHTGRSRPSTIIRWKR